MVQVAGRATVARRSSGSAGATRFHRSNEEAGEDAHTLWACQSVAAISSSGVARFARRSRLITVSNLLIGVAGGQLGDAEAVLALTRHVGGGLVVAVVVSSSVAMVGSPRDRRTIASVPRPEAPTISLIGAASRHLLDRDSRDDQRSATERSPIGISSLSARQKLCARSRHEYLTVS